MTQQPKLPDGTWSVNKDEKKMIREFGRELTKFILDYAQKNSVAGHFFHTKIVAGGFQYFMEVQNQKAKLVGDDVLVSQATIEKYGLNKLLAEPFEEEPEAPAPEDKPAEAAPAGVPSPIQREDMGPEGAAA